MFNVHYTEKSRQMSLEQKHINLSLPRGSNLLQHISEHFQLVQVKPYFIYCSKWYTWLIIFKYVSL